MSFWIVTGPVRSGKTTALSQWLKRYNKAGGFLTPDGADGLRLFYDVGNGELLPFEVGELTQPVLEKNGLAPEEPKVGSKNVQTGNRSRGATRLSLAPPERFIEIGSELQTLRFSEAQLVAQENRSIDSSPIVEVGRFRFHKRAFDLGNDMLLHAHEQDAEVITLDEWGKLELRGKGFAKGAEYITKKALTGELSADLVVVVRDYLLDDFHNWCSSLIPAEEVLCSPKILDLPTE